MTVPKTARQMRKLVRTRLDEAKELVGVMHPIQIARIAAYQVASNPKLRDAAQRAGKEWMDEQEVLL